MPVEAAGRGRKVMRTQHAILYSNQNWAVIHIPVEKCRIKRIWMVDNLLTIGSTYNAAIKVCDARSGANPLEMARSAGSWLLCGGRDIDLGGGLTTTYVSLPGAQISVIEPDLDVPGSAVIAVMAYVGAADGALSITVVTEPLK
jgi:hypothetical protein